jgi:uncharacterized protein with NAD-binding domain and iron-sulfur cluster
MEQAPSHGKTAAIYGAGIAGLTVAHELASRGWRVSVYEANDEAGGFFRSARRRGEGNMPSEYSWHGFGPWYHNVFDVLRQVPSRDHATLYERVLSRPIDFGTAPDTGTAQFDDTGPFPDVRRMFRMTRLDRLRWAWLMLKTWTAHRRSERVYAQLDAAEQWRRVLSPTAWSSWVACFGPWIGSDWKKVSLHTAGLFFRRQLMTQPPHAHAADAEGPAWSQGSRSGWLVLRAPSSEAWFDPWVAHLQRLGVRFQFGQSLQRLEFDGQLVTAAMLASQARIEADLHVLATHPFAAADILDRTPPLAQLEQLRNFRPLVQDGPHTQVSFRVAFTERIRWPRPRCALVIVDSEFDLTMFAEEQAWSPAVDLGEDVRSLWTVTACVSSVPGRVHGLPLERCTEAQFREEVLAQLLRCGALDALVREANDGRPLASFPVAHVEVWHEWTFSPDGIRPRQPKWVTTTHTQRWLPDQRTPVPNLVLAGAHTRTDADVWSIEGAVESGRRAARLVEPDVVVLPQYVPRVLCWLRAVDDALFAIRGPHVLQVLVAALAVAIALGAFALLR